ncbi:UNVERIFIED_CONTAM: hypothetical protein NCL1_12001 [Trichonephila clavipes]
MFHDSKSTIHIQLEFRHCNSPGAKSNSRSIEIRVLLINNNTIEIVIIQMPYFEMRITSSEGVVSGGVEAVTIDPATAASAHRAAATCGVPIADARGWGSSRNGGNDLPHVTSPPSPLFRHPTPLTV